MDPPTGGTTPCTIHPLGLIDKYFQKYLGALGEKGEAQPPSLVTAGVGTTAM